MGIDAQAELVKDGNPTYKLIALQIKTSGTHAQNRIEVGAAVSNAIGLGRTLFGGDSVASSGFSCQIALLGINNGRSKKYRSDYSCEPIPSSVLPAADDFVVVAAAHIGLL